MLFPPFNPLTATMTTATAAADAAADSMEHETIEEMKRKRVETDAEISRLRAELEQRRGLNAP